MSFPSRCVKVDYSGLLPETGSEGQVKAPHSADMTEGKSHRTSWGEEGRPRLLQENSSTALSLDSRLSTIGTIILGIWTLVASGPFAKVI